MKKFFTLFALVLMSCMGAWAQTTWSHTDLTDAKKVQFQSYWENTKKLGVNSAGTALETTAAQNTKFIIAESETPGQYYLYDPTTKRYVSKATGSSSKSGETMNVTASKTDAGKFSFVASTATGQDDSKPKICIQCMNPVGTNVMIHHASETEAKAFGAANTTEYGGNGWQIVSLEDATEEEMAIFNGPTEDDITALQTKISEVYAQCKTLGEKRVGYPNYTTNSEAIDALFLYTENFENSITPSNYDAALAALNAVYALTDVNLPEDGKAYTITSVTRNGTTRVISYNSTTQQLAIGSSDDNVFICHKLDNGKYVFTNNSGKYMRLLANSYKGDGTKWNDAYDATWSSFSIAKMPTEGNHYDSNTTADKVFGLLTIQGPVNGRGNGTIYLMAAASQFNSGNDNDLYFTDSGNSCGFRFEEVENPNKVVLTKPASTFEGGLNGKYVGTFSAPYNVQLPDGVVAYTANLEDNNVTFEELGNVVPKNTGVVLYAAEATEAINAKAVPATSTVAVGTNRLVGTNGADVTVDAGVNAYIMSVDATEGVKFFKLADGDRTIARNKAYLDLTSHNSNLLNFRFDFESNPTAINGIETNATAAPIFDLQGRRVQNIQSGLYIVNGKKVLR